MNILRVEHTPNPAAFKFVLDGPVCPEGTRAFAQATADEHPLARSLCALGAVQVLLCGDFVSVSLAEAEDWDDARGAVQSAIALHFQQAKTGSTATTVAQIRVKDVAATGDPAERCFVLTAPVITGDPRLYNIDHDELSAPPLAQALFKVGATDVTLDGDRITVTMFSERAWEHFVDDAKTAIETHLDGGSVKESRSTASVLDMIDKATFPGLPKEEKLNLINALFDEMVRPALANDGGGLEVLDLDGSDVKIKYQGACGGCSHSASGTLRAIDRCLKSYLDPTLTATPV